MALTPTQLSPSGSPPDYCAMDAAYESSQSPVERRLSDVATETLSKLTDFSQCSLHPDKINPTLITAFSEISPDIFTDPLALSDENLALILKHCPLMKNLHLYGFHQITDIALHAIANLQHLSTLNLSGTQVKNLAPLINRPLNQLTTVNFYDTQVNFESLDFFLQRHRKIQHLTPPQNPPASFFDSLPCDAIQYVKIQIDEGKDIPFSEISRFFKNAPQLQKLIIKVHGSVRGVNFEISTDSPTATTRDLNFESTNVIQNLTLKRRN